MSRGLEIRIDREACRGAAECLFRAPGTFELDERNRARVREQTTDSPADILMAARSCPNFAIRVEEAGKVLA